MKAESFAAEAFNRVLYRLGLERLAPLLDTTHRWDRELSQDEQLCLAVARILLQAPPWVLIDGTFGMLDDDVLDLVIDVFTTELKSTAIIHIGGPAQAHPLFTRVLHLVKAPHTRKTVLAAAPPGGDISEGGVSGGGTSGGASGSGVSGGGVSGGGASGGGISGGGVSGSGTPGGGVSGSGTPGGGA
jgi:putative ATP-binding cassette transporter